MAFILEIVFLISDLFQARLPEWRPVNLAFAVMLAFLCMRWSKCSPWVTFWLTFKLGLHILMLFIDEQDSDLWFFRIMISLLWRPVLLIVGNAPQCKDTFEMENSFSADLSEIWRYVVGVTALSILYSWRIDIGLLWIFLSVFVTFMSTILISRIFYLERQTSRWRQGMMRRYEKHKPPLRSISNETIISNHHDIIPSA